MGLAINVDISGFRNPEEPELATSEVRMLSDIEAESTSDADAA
ncbi:hypothetical protein [Streptomyces sp. TS71-3]|nr:hypothetical protein [Streptomyces sp. TS71-3]GHJ41917.1 hypothetical protein Sm713_75260 [Streptomyces sp. TS71-3]